MQDNQKFYVHPSAIVEKDVMIGERSSVWHHCHLREKCVLDSDVSLGKGVFIDQGVHIGRGCRIQNGVSVYHGVILKDWTFVGPNVTFTNDRFPRAGNRNWTLSRTVLEEGCSIGAGSTVLCDLTIGSFALVGAGSIVTESIPPFHLAYGLPAKIQSKICACGSAKLKLDASNSELLRDCCVSALKPEVLELARRAVKNLEKNKT